MVMILERIETSLADFRPQTQAEFVALQLARRFDDINRFPRYLAAAKTRRKHALLEAANVALMRHELNRMPTSELFFEALSEADGKEQP